ncbi:MAG: DedA family protein [Cyanobacteriota bacterium]|nr:DedA family protein [Cyanobacteriota bacterium]
MLADLTHRISAAIDASVAADPRLGYLALALAMLLENLIPPIPSEVILPLGGFLVQQGKLQLLPTVLACLAGTVLGALPWYAAGRLVKEERLTALLAAHGHWLGLDGTALARSRAWFGRHGATLVFWGRMVPAVRTLISVPAGLERMALAPFLLWTTAGSLIWTVLLTSAGMALGEGYAGVGAWLAPYAGASRALLIVAAVAGLLVLLGRRRAQARIDRSGPGR